jgi:ABC-type multidrug transport system fused ATPase/permease subunit
MLLAKPDATEKEIMTALKLANCNFVERMEDGIETSVGSGGGKLSGGQK